MSSETPNNYHDNRRSSGSEKNSSDSLPIEVCPKISEQDETCMVDTITSTTTPPNHTSNNHNTSSTIHVNHNNEHNQNQNHNMRSLNSKNNSRSDLIDSTSSSQPTTHPLSSSNTDHTGRRRDSAVSTISNESNNLNLSNLPTLTSNSSSNQNINQNITTINNTNTTHVTPNHHTLVNHNPQVTQRRKTSLPNQARNIDLTNIPENNLKFNSKTSSEIQVANSLITMRNMSSSKECLANQNNYTTSLNQNQTTKNDSYSILSKRKTSLKRERDHDTMSTDSSPRPKTISVEETLQQLHRNIAIDADTSSTCVEKPGSESPSLENNTDPLETQIL